MAHFHLPDTRITQANAAFFSLLRTMGTLRHVMEPFFATHGLTGAQWMFLWILHSSQQAGQDVRLKDLSQKMMIRPPSATVLVGRLVRDGLVRRVDAAGDHRSQFIKLTPAGKKRVTRVSDAHAAQIDQVMAGFSPSDLQQFQTLMDRMRRHLDAMAPGGSPETVFSPVRQS